MSSAIITLLTFLPFGVILWLASLADRRSIEGAKHPVLAGVSYFLLIGFYGTLILLGLFLWAAGILSMPLPEQMLASFQQMGLDAAGAHTALAGVGLGFWLPSLVGIVLILPPVRRLLAHLLPIDPSRTVHAVALSYTMIIVINLMVTLGAGLNTLASMMKNSAQSSGNSVGIGAVWMQEGLMALLALIGVGWLSRRRLGDALRRLGLTVPSWRQLALGLAIGVALAPLILLSERLLSGVGVSSDADVERLTEALLGPLFASIPGILTLGLAAALGEELIFRGALQPRFGIIVTAALFALTHSNYGITLSTAIVLLLGVVLGLLRRRGNTTMSMCTHAAYNITLGLVAFFHLM